MGCKTACKEVLIAFIIFMLQQHLKTLMLQKRLGKLVMVLLSIIVWEQELVSVDRSQLSSHHHHSPSVCVPLPLLVRSVPDSLRKAGRFALSAVSVGLSFSGVFPPWFLSSKITFSCIWSQRMTHIWESGPKAEVEAA
ncbi:hypothetical protein QQF64_022837 [Cirrhinus molitorella]|uniref:Uncharacterized protein n=1 Tax=Cirrhinus molitorella TaxID=172907 RepID=A0ABR3L3H0_9TELE